MALIQRCSHKNGEDQHVEERDGKEGEWRNPGHRRGATLNPEDGRGGAHNQNQPREHRANDSHSPMEIGSPGSDQAGLRQEEQHPGGEDHSMYVQQKAQLRCAVVSLETSSSSHLLFGQEVLT